MRFTHGHYVPILKAKQGEIGALTELDESRRYEITPLIEIPPHSTGTKPLSRHIADTMAKLVTAWGPHRFWLDLNLLPTAPVEQRAPLAIALDVARAEQVPVVPVVNLASDDRYVRAVAEAVVADRNGVCIRVDMRSPHSLADRLQSLMAVLEVEPVEVDLVLDFGHMLPGQAGTLSLAAAAVLGALPFVDQWRTLTVAGTAAPIDVSAQKRDSVDTLERTEWLVWKQLLAQLDDLPRVPTFGDYGVTHPQLPDVDPAMMNMTAKLRYTAGDNWLQFKGRGVKKHGYEQFNGLCKALVARPEFAGGHVSWGNAYYAACAKGEQGPGNATVWKQASTEQHLTAVAGQLASLTASSGSPAPVG